MLRFFARRKLDPERVLVDVLGGFELPSFPAGVAETLRLLRHPDSTFVQIGRSVEANPGLVIPVLRAVNSAAFGLRRRVASVSQAAGLLGRSRMESLVVAVAIQRQLPASPLAGGPAFWRVAARRATLARELAELLHPETRADAFVAGLLQDMAVPLLASLQPAAYAAVLHAWRGDPEAHLEHLERDAFGWDHGRVGASMAAHWSLPDALVDAIGGHHDPDDEDALPAARLVSVLRDDGGQTDVEELVTACRDRFGLAPDQVVRRVAAAFDEADEFAALMA